MNRQYRRKRKKKRKKKTKPGRYNLCSLATLSLFVFSPRMYNSSDPGLA